MASALFVSGCGKKAATAEEQCSAQSTYDQIIDLIVGQIAQARSMYPATDIVSAASSTKALKNVLRFEMPTVTDVNSATHKVSCEAMMRVTADSQAQQLLNTTGLETNEVAPDHLQLRVHYSMQPMADTGRPVLELEQASSLAAIGMQASMAAVQRIRDASGTSATPTVTPTEVPGNSSDATPPDGEENAARPQNLVPDGGAQDGGSQPSDPANITSGEAADRARTFVTDYFERSQGDPDAALAWMAAHYADTVRFFGTATGRNDILKQKADYLQRWPQRTYTVEPGSVSVECKPGQPLCHVAGIIDWSTSSSARNASTSGKSAFDLVTLGNDGNQTIVAENSRVISRAH